MERPDFRTALHEADAKLDSWRMSSEADARIRRSLGGEIGPRRSRVPRARYTWAMVGCVLAFVVAVVAFQRPTLRRAKLEVEASTFAVTDATPDLKLASERGAVTIRAGRCTLADARAGIRMRVVAPTVLHEQQGGLRVVRGTIDVEVESRPAAPPRRILVSHGAIEVLGTRFTIVQETSSGRVVLHEGALRFVASVDGRTLTLRPGDALSWPLHPPDEPAATAVDAAVERAATRQDDASSAREDRIPIEPVPELLSRIASLRSRAQFGKAAEQLQIALRAPYPSGVRERLSYELGSILSHQLGQHARACAHWRKHRATFPGTRYEQEIRRAWAASHCGVLSR